MMYFFLCPPECTAHAVDDCLDDLIHGLQLVHNILSAENCQKYCNLIYPSKCKFFFYDKERRVCYLSFLEDETTVLQKCKKVLGPKFPVKDDCNFVKEPCSVSNSV
jgi:hypothetical protein